MVAIPQRNRHSFKNVTVLRCGDLRFWRWTAERLQPTVSQDCVTNIQCSREHWKFGHIVVMLVMWPRFRSLGHKILLSLTTAHSSASQGPGVHARQGKCSQCSRLYRLCSMQTRKSRYRMMPAHSNASYSACPTLSFILLTPAKTIISRLEYWISLEVLTWLVLFSATLRWWFRCFIVEMRGRGPWLW